MSDLTKAMCGGSWGDDHQLYNEREAAKERLAKLTKQYEEKDIERVAMVEKHIQNILSAQLSVVRLKEDRKSRGKVQRSFVIESDIPLDQYGVMAKVADWYTFAGNELRAKAREDIKAAWATRIPALVEASGMDQVGDEGWLMGVCLSELVICCYGKK